MRRVDSMDQIQRWFQAVTTHPDGVEEGMASNAAREWLGKVDAQEVIQPSQRLTSIERLSIYANAYYARLIDCMGAYFPVLKRTLGSDVFNSFVLEYLQQHPSHSYTLDHLGDRFTQFLADTRPRDEEGGENWPDFLIDLSTLEWTIARVFDDAGNEGKQLLTAEMLQTIPAEHFSKAKLLLVESLHLLTFRFPVSAYYSKVKHAAEEEEFAIPDPATEFVAVLRRDYIVRRYPLTEPQFVLLQNIFNGACIHDAIFAAAEISEMDDSSLIPALQIWFQDWSRAGFFSGISF
jgi:hypothetical protein